MSNFQRFVTSPATDDAAERLRSAIARALAEGFSHAEIYAMIAAAPAPPHGLRGGNIVYDRPPAGLISVPAAAKKYGVRGNTLSVAIHRGLLVSLGQIKGRGGGGFNHLVSEAELRHYLNLPPEEDDVQGGDASASG